MSEPANPTVGPWVGLPRRPPRWGPPEADEVVQWGDTPITPRANTAAAFVALVIGATWAIDDHRARRA